MDNYGVTSTGFKVKTRDVIIADLKQSAKELFGESVNTADNSPIGILIGLMSWPLTLIWQVLLALYNSAYVDTATDQSLENVGHGIGLSMKPAGCAIWTERFSGTSGTVIPADFLIDTGGSNPVSFATLEEVTIPAAGYIDVKIKCLQSGIIGNVPVGTITNSRLPITGLTLTNTAIYSAGTAKETNYKFRVRYKKCVAKGGASTIDNIIATVLNDTSAADVVVIENDTDDADAAGRPGHHLEVVVLGGTADEIAQAIYKSKGGGIGLVGTNEKLVNDLGGHPHLVKWNSAEQVTIYFKIVLTISSLFPTDGEKQIKDNIIGYVGGTNSADEIIDGLKIGKSVIAVKIPKLIEIEGVEDAQITFGTAADPTTNSNIVMEYNQKAITGLSQVVISYNE